MNKPAKTQRSTNSSPTSNGSGTPQKTPNDGPDTGSLEVVEGGVPALTGQAWDEPAPRDLIRLTVVAVANLMEPDMEGDRLQHLVAYLSSRDYTTAELKYAAQELPEDETLNTKHRYGKEVTPGDFRRVIEKTRTLREKVDQPLTTEQMRHMIDLEPQLKREHFTRKQVLNEEQKHYVLRPEPLAEIFGIDRKRDDVPQAAYA